jgi:hypothetical protein
MKLEPDLIKEILQFCEDKLPDDDQMWSASNLEIKGFDSKQIIFHAKLLHENGYIKGEIADTLSERDFDFDSLTMNGYQYLALLKGKAWNTAKGMIHEFGVIFAEGAIRAIIDKYSPIILP